MLVILGITVWFATQSTSDTQREMPAQRIHTTELSQGEGERASQGDKVTVSYRLYSASDDPNVTRERSTTTMNQDGAPVRRRTVERQEASQEPARSATTTFRVLPNDGPPGLADGVLGMRVGGTRQVFVPPELGFKEESRFGISPGTVLEYTVTLLEVM